jgi:20S proteasome subunit alpha 3
VNVNALSSHSHLHAYLLLYRTRAGNYGGWKARAVGANSSAAQSLLKDDYKEGCDLKEAQMLALKTLSKTMDNTSPTSENLEFATVTRNAQTNEVEYKVMSKAELNELLKEAAPMLKAAQAEASDL